MTARPSDDGSASDHSTDDRTSGDSGDHTSAGRPTGLRSARTARLVAVVAGIVGVLACILTPLLPVTTTTASISWPTGQRLAADTPSVVAPLAAQTPQTLTATIPCSLFSALGTSGTLLATMPTGADGASQKSLVVAATAQTATVSFRGEVAASAARSAVASPQCRSLSIEVSPTRTSAQFVGLGPAGVVAPDKRPQVSGIYSTLTTPQVQAAVAQGLRVDVGVDSRYSSSPTVLKLLVMIVGIVAVALALLALARLDWLGGHHRRVGVRSWRRVLAPRVSDLAVTAVMILWLFLGAGTPDDGYILTMGRAADAAGYLANYYRWFDIPEAPFDWYYSLLGHWSQVSTAGLWMHLPALAAALASWFVLSRVLLPRMGAAVRRSGWAIWAAAALFVAFWLPFDSGLRSEPIIVAGSLLTWWGVEQAIGTRRLLPAALATLAAGLTLALAPHGVIAVAVLIAGSRAMLAVVLRRRREAGIAALVLPVVAAGLLTLVVVFRDQTLATVYDAVRIRFTVGPALSWHEEYFRYFFITVSTDDGALTRRVPVLLLLASVFVVLAVMLRRKRIRGIDPGPVWRGVGAVGVTLVLWVFAPTKWTIQFGIFAGVAAALAAVATVAIAQSAARSARNLAVLVAGLLFALAASMAGKNAWPWAYDFGISWFDRAPVLAGIQVSSILLVLAVLASAAAVWLHLRVDFVAHRGMVHESDVDVDAPVDTASRADRRRLTLASSPIAVIAILMVVAELAVFAKAAVARGSEFTVVGANVHALSGDTCAMANDVLVEPDVNTGMLTPADGRSQSAALAGTDAVGFTPNGVASDLSPDATQSKPGQMNVAGIVQNPFNVVGGSAGTLGGNGPRTVNGSTVALPFGLDPARTPVLGSYGYDSGKASLTTDWYRLPRRGSTPLIVLTAAGAIASVDVDGVGEFGRSLQVQFGTRSATGTFEQVGAPFMPIDPGPEPPNRPWRNLRIPTAAIPPRADVMRVVAVDDNLTSDQWLAITPPRAAQLRTLQDVVGTSTPTLIDFTVAAQFPCQRPIVTRHGVTEVPRWRILPDRITALSQSKTWMDSDDGGLLGISEGTTTPTTVPSYLRDDWYRDWGSLERLTPLAGDAPAATTTLGEQNRWGWSREGSIRVVRSDDS
ncbi:arabinosyltransferase domain-containing protein [Williamsia deligens]|uniref:Arabinosyltransferase domain-containing protein n=1 Tax=Williamsia deligens TaxID=321325 RepID=A0ABW3G8B4_9NOCA|nr:arabinosyltransferase domain-containing protein [Williamsia deligens]MCP2193976.1 arabinosyltransferase A [Williamsia deligens]